MARTTMAIDANGFNGNDFGKSGSDEYRGINEAGVAAH